MDKDMVLKREFKREKEREAEPVMVMIKYQVLDGEGHMTATQPMPKAVFDSMLNFYSSWESTTEMTHNQFKHYESLLDEKKMEEARKKLEDKTD